MAKDPWNQMAESLGLSRERQGQEVWMSGQPLCFLKWRLDLVNKVQFLVQCLWELWPP